MNLLAGMDSPTAGSLYVGDLEVSSLSRGQLVDYRRQKVGVVFQFFNLIPNLTALENIQFVTELTGTGGNAIDALNSVGLDGRQNHFPHELSGGEQQLLHGLWSRLHPFCWVMNPPVIWTWPPVKKFWDCFKIFTSKVAV
jgi:ABC-type lipoprotein export system ATPase subunit